MRGPRLSIASLTGIVAVIALGFGCLLYASSAWAEIAVVAYCAALGLGPVGIVYRRERSRAFYVGFTIWIWGYFALTSLPIGGVPGTHVRGFVDWLYWRLIPESRRPESHATILIPWRLVVNDQPLENLGESVDISPEGSRSRLALSARTRSLVGNDGPQFDVDAHEVDFVRQAIAQGKRLKMTACPVIPPTSVDLESFKDVGTAVLGLLAGILGGIIASWFDATRRADNPTA